MKKLFLSVMALLVFLMFAVPSFAVEPDEMLQDPVLEARAREISKHLRCLVCQGEAIDDSNADFAKDLRLFVRTRIAAGDSDEVVIQDVRERYGDFILLRPPVEEKTILLWLTPALVFLLGLGTVVVFMRRQRED